MAKLQDEVKAHIVIALACYDTPSEVAEAVKRHFAIDVSRQQVSLYDPEKYVGRSLGAKWKALFFDTRKKFREEMVEIPLVHRAVRLRVLQRLLDEADDKGNISLALQILEQAAREVGDMFVNARRGAPASAVGGLESVQYRIDK